MIERITRSLAYMLRHQPEQFDLEVDSHGFADLDDVVRALNERLGEPVEEEDVHTAVGSGDRQRYEIKNGRIRALYGHSIEVEAGEPSKPPELLFVGLSGRDADRASRSGLRGGRRRFLHLALTEDDARETGRRSDEEYAIVTVRALDAWEEGINFFDRKSLFLAESIPTRFIDVSELFTDGVGPQQRHGGRDGRRGERSERGDRRGERGRERERGGDRGDDRDRGRGRGRDRDRDRNHEERRSDDSRRRPAARGESRADGDGRRRGRRDDRRDDRREDRHKERPRDDSRRRPAARDRDRERPPAQDRDSAPKKTATSSEPQAAFGTGIFEEDAKAPKKRPARPKREAAPAQSPPKPEKSEPEAPVAERREEEQGSGFGAGLD